MATKQDCLNEIGRIEDAKEDLALAIEEKGVEVPQGTRIEGYPNLVRQIVQGAPEAVLYIPQELTNAQKTQARQNIGASDFSGNYEDLSNRPDSVLYSPQQLLEAQYMQARQNLDLYRIEEGEGEVTWDGYTFGLPQIPQYNPFPQALYKVADFPTLDDIDATQNVVLTDSQGEEWEFSLYDYSSYFQSGECYGIEHVDSIAVICKNATLSFYDTTIGEFVTRVFNGVFFSEDARALTYQGNVIRGIDPKYLPKGEKEILIVRPGETSAQTIIDAYKRGQTILLRDDTGNYGFTYYEVGIIPLVKVENYYGDSNVWEFYFVTTSINTTTPRWLYYTLSVYYEQESWLCAWVDLPTTSPGTLNTTLTTSQTPASNESLANTINLHKVSKTGSFNDLNDKPEPQIFWATYGTTTLAEITTAYNAGKVVAVLRGNSTYILGNLQSTYCYFYALNKTTLMYLLLNVSTWSAGQATAQTTSNLVTSLSPSSDDTHYPGAKCVYDELAKKYEKPQTGIPASDIEQGVIPDVSNFITKSVNDLTYYYLKSETYTRAEVQALIGAIQQFHYEIYPSTSAVQSPANNVLYLIGPTGSGSDKYEEYVYDSTKQDPWIKIGDTSIDLTGYVTTQALNSALADYTTTENLTTLLAGKQDLIDANHKLDYSLLSNTPNAVLYSSQSLTDAQKTQARENIDADGDYFEATYGTTTAQEIKTARDAGKKLRLHYAGDAVIFPLTDYLYDSENQTLSATFSVATGAFRRSCTITSVDGWSEKIEPNLSPRLFLGKCPTAAGTATKVVTVATFPLDENNLPLVGTTIAVKFTNTNSASSPKLDVNGTGAKSIYYNAGAYTASSSVAGSAARYSFFVWDGTYWVWLSWGTDNDTNTIAYNVRFNTASRKLTDYAGRYRLLFSSADNSQWVSPTTSTSTNATSSRSVNQRPINPFGPIVYYASTTAKSAGEVPGATSLYSQYVFTLGYSFNRTGAALTLTTNAPVYIKCAPQSDGSAVIDATTPYVQTLPSSEDGKIYIYLGNAASTTTVELSYTHPVFYYKDGGIREWTSAKPSDVVLYTSQSLSEDQKMQARRNQGLYGDYPQEMTLTWDGDTTGRDSFYYADADEEYFKIADLPDADGVYNLLSYIMTTLASGGSTPYEYTFQVPQVCDDNSEFIVSGKFVKFTGIAFVKDAVFSAGGTPHTGVYFFKQVVNSQTTIYTSSYTFNALVKTPVPTDYLPVVKTLSSSSTDSEIPSAKCVYDIVGDIETLLAAL